jgi:hypothetical protein
MAGQVRVHAWWRRRPLSSVEVRDRLLATVNGLVAIEPRIGMDWYRPKGRRPKSSWRVDLSPEGLLRQLESWAWETDRRTTFTRIIHWPVSIANDFEGIGRPDVSIGGLVEGPDPYPPEFPMASSISVWLKPRELSPGATQAVCEMVKRVWEPETVQVESMDSIPPIELDPASL